MRYMVFLFCIGLFSMSFAQAPRQLATFLKSGVIDSISMNEFDSLTIDNKTDFIIHLKNGTLKTTLLKQIDHIAFPFVGGPVARVIAPNGGETYRVGDSLTIQWQVNPIAMTGAKKVSVFIATVSQPQEGICDSCWTELNMRGGALGTDLQVYNTDARYSASYVATCKVLITSWMVSSKCMLKVGDYQRYNYNEYSDVSNATFSIVP